jgi:hypothetical protein
LNRIATRVSLPQVLAQGGSLQKVSDDYPDLSISRRISNHARDLVFDGRAPRCQSYAARYDSARVGQSIPWVGPLLALAI